MKQVKIYTDGACTCNPGDGGYCAILIYNGIEKIVSGFEKETTNNRMEIMAVIKGLEALKEPCAVEVYSDSQYVVNAFSNGWIVDWQKKGWKTSSKTAVKNVDLWQKLLVLTDYHSVNFIKVKGHSNNDYNNRCDEIARLEYKKINNEC